MFNIFKKKKRKMAQEIKEPAEKKYYQWVKGDNVGMIVEYTHEENGYMVFSNGSRLKNEFSTEYLMEVDSDTPPLEVEVPVAKKATPQQERRISINNIPDSNSENKKMLERMKKAINGSSKKEVKFNLKLVNRELYSAMCILMEEDEVREMIIEITMGHLKEELINYINSYYNGENF